MENVTQHPTQECRKSELKSYRGGYVACLFSFSPTVPEARDKQDGFLSCPKVSQTATGHKLTMGPSLKLVSDVRHQLKKNLRSGAFKQQCWSSLPRKGSSENEIFIEMLLYLQALVLPVCLFSDQWGLKAVPRSMGNRLVARRQGGWGCCSPKGATVMPEPGTNEQR